MLPERAGRAQLDAGRTPAGRTLEALYFICPSVCPSDAKMTDRLAIFAHHHKIKKVGRGEGRGEAAEDRAHGRTLVKPYFSV